MLPEVPQFRNYLLKTLDPKRVDIKLLEGKYVPNLTPTPFEVSIAYVEDIIKVTNGASLLKDLLQSRKFDLQKSDDKQLLGYFILVELLVYATIFLPNVLRLSSLHHQFVGLKHKMRS